jgi:predicted NBD/HSP70 family sugar kinase
LTFKPEGVGATSVRHPLPPALHADTTPAQLAISRGLTEEDSGTRADMIRTSPPPLADVTRREASTGLVLRTILDSGPLPRSAIARATGLSPASVTAHAGELASCGLLGELPQTTAPNGLGRPYVPLELNLSAGVVAGIHLAVDCATVAVLDLRGVVLSSYELPHAGAGPEAIIARSAQALAEQLRTSSSERPLLGIGVASGGWVDRASGTIVEHAMLGWQRVAVGEPLQRRFGVPVLVDSHARSLIRAEQLFGNRRARQSTLALFVGNVVEAAFSMGDQLHYGPHSRAGAIAHLPVPGSQEACGCGKFGCLEATASERRLVRRAAVGGVPTRRRIDDVVEAAVSGNALARELFRERAAAVGRTLAPIIDLLSPELVLIVDPGAAYLPECLAALREQVAVNSVTVSDPTHAVVVSSFMDTVLATAGGAVILDGLYANPSAVVRLSHSS